MKPLPYLLRTEHDEDQFRIKAFKRLGDINRRMPIEYPKLSLIFLYKDGGHLHYGHLRVGYESFKELYCLVCALDGIVWPEADTTREDIFYESYHIVQEWLCR